MNAPSPSHLTFLVEELREAKSQEDQAKARRLDIEEKIISLVPPCDGMEGTTSIAGLSIAYKVTRKVDSDALFAAFNTLPVNAQKAFRFKAEVALTQFRALKEFDAALYAKVADFVTTTPAKPSITLKAL